MATREQAHVVGPSDVTPADRDDYRRDMAKLDVAARELVETRILPEQLKTHDAMSALKKQLS